MIYRLLLRPILFQFDAEKVHNFTFTCLSFFGKIPFLFSFIKFLYKPTNPKLETNLFGIKFPSPVGLAAGLDKNAKLINEFSSLGFGFIEIGTVTPKPQDGNPKKRLFRLLDDQAVINRMGFNNDGVEKIASRLKKRGYQILWSKKLRVVEKSHKHRLNIQWIKQRSYRLGVIGYYIDKKIYGTFLGFFINYLKCLIYFLMSLFLIKITKSMNFIYRSYG